MIKSKNLVFLETWIERVWVNEDESAIAHMFADSGPATGLGQAPVTGPAEFLEFHRILLNLVGDVTIDIEHFLEQGDCWSYMGVFRAKCRKTGEPVSMNGGAMCRVQNGKMVEAYNAWDFLTLFVELGLAPEDAFIRGLSGQSLSS